MSLYVDIRKRCGDFRLDVRFETRQENFAILGTSGAGKSMILKCIAGIEKPDEGVIILNGKTIFDSKRKINVPIRKRKIGYMFQDYALFPNMTVEENIDCGSGDKKITKEYIRACYLEGKEKLYPSQLSGGQKQRVALARMLSSRPELILLDEPFSALDQHLKNKLEIEVMQILKAYGKDTILVSHDRNEVYRLTERIAVLEHGKIVDMQSKYDLFHAPKTLAATILTGCKNISRLEKQVNGTYEALDWGISVPCPAEKKKYRYVGIRAHYLEIVDELMDKTCIECRVVRRIEDIFSDIYYLEPESVKEKTEYSVLTLEIEKNRNIKIEKENVYIRIPTGQMIFLEE